MSIEENEAVAGQWLAEFRKRDFSPAITVPVRPGLAAEHFRMGGK